MGARIAYCAFVLILLLLMSSVGASASPEVSITEPVDGTLLRTSSVVVAGTASGSHASWTHGGAADFATGVLGRVVVDGGTIRLDRWFIDGFDDNAFNSSLWEKSDVGGVVTTEENGGLHLHGTNEVTSYWGGNSVVLSKGPVGDSVEAYLAGCVGSGSGYGALVVLFQDGSNQAGIGIQKDRDWYGENPYVYWGCINQGVQTNGILTGVSGISHVFKVTYRSGTVEMYVDGAVVKTLSMTLANAKAKIFARARANGDTVDAIWDDFKADYATSGTYVSSVHDTRSVDPVLTRVDWNATVPSGTTLRIEVRSSDSPDMGSATDWTEVAKGQASGLPATRRYVQYRATLGSADLDSPSLKDVTVSYQKPVRWVDVSLDQASWTRASGKESWSTVLEVPDGPVTVWVRVTDVAGDVRTASVTFDVDTTPPTGSVVINNGDAMTAFRNVTLTLRASDGYGVADMMLSESPAFVDAQWIPFEPTRSLTLTRGDGNKTVFARFRDRNGWISATVNDSIVLDITPPWGSIIIDDGAEYTNRSSVMLALEASGMVAVSEMKVGDSPGLSSLPWRPFARTLEWQLPPGDGTKAVHALFRDLEGLESVMVSDSIILDTTAPILHVSIDRGAAFTGDREVQVELEAEDLGPITTMQVGEGPALAGVEGTPFDRSFGWTFDAGDGERTLYARVRDAAGNVGPIGSDSIVLDTHGPSLDLKLAVVRDDEMSVDLRWEGVDELSGLATYFVQYRDGNGGWTDLAVRTLNITATFRGEDGHNYSFQAWAEDNVGNVGNKTVLPGLLLRYALPNVTITEPTMESALEGFFHIKGTATPTHMNRSIVRVLVSVDGGEWAEAVGKGTWDLRFDGRRLADGPHVASAKAFDGVRWSSEAEVTLTVENVEPSTGISDWWLVIILVLALVGVTVAYYTWRSGKVG